MPRDAERGNHAYLDVNDLGQCQEVLPPKSVFDAECAAIEKRRQRIKTTQNRDRTASPLTGISLSGGGIRSASFGLGALQALDVSCGIERYSGLAGIDYLSTVSGGGYIGCALTAATQKTSGNFPFTNPDNYDDTESVHHIRDFSNYLIPHGIMDLVTALGIIGRGLVANALILLPVLFFLVWITLVLHPTVASLDRPAFLLWDPGDGGLLPRWFWRLPGFWFTALLLPVNLLFLTGWALYTSLCLAPYHTLKGGWVGVSKALFVVTVVTAFLEFQPFILKAMATAPAAAVDASSVRPAGIGGPGGLWSYIAAALASMGTLFAFLSKYLSDIVAAAKHATDWPAWLKKIFAMAALWLAAFIVPFFLWLSYLGLTYTGIFFPASARWISFGAFIGATAVAFGVDPNRTSLYRLYRDRLCKAFQFDPTQRENLHIPNDPHDLQPYEPKLHEIDTDLCPYPIVNAALNIEGSQYANKRGRNADFFIFTPEYLGSDATGYIGSRRMEKDEPTLNLGSSMAISGAAVSSNMGALTIKPLAFTLAVLNVRLGYWLRNPRPASIHPPVTQRRDWLTARLFELPSFVLFAEMFSWITEKSPKVFLTDGGHIENLGVYSLLKRRCKVIIAIDAEADPTMSFGSLLTLERYARIDLGAIINLPWDAIRNQALAIAAAFDEAIKNGSSPPCSLGPHCAAGEIQYGPNETGILLYVKASLSGDEPDYILDYKKRHRTFPHETTGDQFFGEEQLEVYRALGFHIVKGVLTGEAPFAVDPRPGESMAQARRRILDDILVALRGTEAAPPAAGTKPPATHATA